ncbi:MAG: glycosyltransferase family 4 protein [Verrucomicrobiota bacterium]
MNPQHSLVSWLAPILSRTLPTRVRWLLRTIIDWPKQRLFIRQLNAQNFQLPTSGPVLNYGMALPRKAGEVIHGGRVKLLHLDRHYPENFLSFNLLYLVSSAIPPHAQELVRFARSRGVKFIWNQNGVAFPGWADKAVEEFNKPMRALRKQADFIVYQSRFCQESAEYFLGPAPTASAVLYNPVDLVQFSPPSDRPALDRWQLLAAGTHMEPERVTKAIETLAELRSRGHAAELTVAGEFRWPRAHEDVKKILALSGMSDWVRFRPAYSQLEAVSLLQSHHILLHLKYADPCPTSVIEALACGLPVVGSRSGGMEELLGTETGNLLPVPLSWETRAYPSTVDIANSVERIFANYIMQSQLARKRAEQFFCQADWIDAHQDIFRNLLIT